MNSIIILQMITLFVHVASKDDCPAECPHILSRSDWNGRSPQAVEYLITPIKYVVIHHTVSNDCDSLDSCSYLLRSIQDFHMDTLDFHDIGYNFMIGGDGNVYEGVGWHKTGAHTRGYNSRSFGIGMIGDFSDKLPTQKALDALKEILACGVELEELDENYQLFGARQVSGTLSPGYALYELLRDKWSHFTLNP